MEFDLGPAGGAGCSVHAGGNQEVVQVAVPGVRRVAMRLEHSQPRRQDHRMHTIAAIPPRRANNTDVALEFAPRGPHIITTTMRSPRSGRQPIASLSQGALLTRGSGIAHPGSHRGRNVLFRRAVSEAIKCRQSGPPARINALAFPPA